MMFPPFLVSTYQRLALETSDRSLSATAARCIRGIRRKLVFAEMRNTFVTISRFQQTGRSARQDNGIEMPFVLIIVHDKNRRLWGMRHTDSTES